MECPACNEKAISFGQWCQKKNAFSTSCASCNSQLKAHISVYVGFALTLASIFALFPFIGDIWEMFGVEINSSKIEVLVTLPVAIIPTFLTWKFGKYVRV
jgi:hypothetical protein